MSQPARILVIGDMHLGRSPARLPDSLAQYGCDIRQLGPVAAWQHAVRFACAQKLDAVVLAGDLVESDNARFEAFGHLQLGINDLTAAGIAVFAVSGNHDVEALPKLASALPGLTVIGAAGQWSEHPLEVAGTSALHLLGWSFPQRQVSTSPLAGRLPSRKNNLPRIGILHCDLDVSSSTYAPVSSAELKASDVDVWMLGHIHKPGLVPHVPSAENGFPAPGYCGSLVGLDPTETGLHGPWLLTTDTTGGVQLEQIPLAPLRWETMSVPVTELDDTAGLFEHIAGAVKQFHSDLGHELDAVKALGCRIRLTGRTRNHHELSRTLADGSLAGQVIPCGECLVFLDRIINRTTPEYDLQQLAHRNDPPGLLARHILALADTDQPDAGLLDRAREICRTTARNRQFITLDLPELSEAELRQLVIRTGLHALDELLVQQGSNDDSA